LRRLLRTGAACGVHLVIRGLPVEAADGIEFITAAGGDDTHMSSAGSLPVRLDGGPPTSRLAS